MKAITLFFFVSLAQISLAQKIKEADVPTAVKSAFAKAYPQTKNARWNKEDNDYEASFKFEKTETSVVFDIFGNIKETENEIEASALPAAITKTLANSYSGYKVTEAAKIVSGNTISYEAEVKKDRVSFDLLFKEDGSLIKKLKTK